MDRTLKKDLEFGKSTQETVAIRHWESFFQLRRQRLFYRAATIQVVVSILWALAQILYSNLLMGFLIALEGLLTLLVILNFKRFRNPETAIILITILLVCGVGGSNIFGGGLAGANASMFLLIPVGAVALGGRRGLWWMIPTIVIVGVMGLLHYFGFSYPNVVPREVFWLDTFLTWLTTITVLSFLIVVYHLTNQRTVEELRQANRRLEKAIENKSQFVAHISHELRTPLHGLLGLIELMEEEQDASRRRYLAEQALRNSSVLLGLLSDLQDLSLVEAGTLALRRERFLLRQTIELVVELIRPRVREKGLELVVKVDPEISQWLYADALRLQQVLVNLLSNAVKYTEKGKVELVVNLLAAEKNGVRLRFSVKDTGPGIEEADRERIFEPFYRGRIAVRHHEGAGLGLPICQKLVQLMGGELGLISTVGVGSEFFFELEMEVAQPPSSMTKIEDGEAGDALKGCRVLVVEDDEISRRLAELMLRGLGCIVTALDNGYDALEAAKHNDFHCVLIDLQMPRMDGVQTAAELQRYWKSTGKANPPVVIMTAHKIDDSKNLGGAEIACVLEKPFSMEKLRSVVSSSMVKREISG